MPETKKPSPNELRDAFAAYEAAVSPLTLAVALGLLGAFIDRHFAFTHKLAMLFGASIGFFFGLKKLIQFLKKRNNDKK
jgi:putative Mn2+ efflux pump MntP